MIIGFHISVLLAHEDADGKDADHAQDNCNIVNQCKHFLLLLFRCREGSAFLPAKFERGAYFLRLPYRKIRFLSRDDDTIAQ